MEMAEKLLQGACGDQQLLAEEGHPLATVPGTVRFEPAKFRTAIGASAIAGGHGLSFAGGTLSSVDAVEQQVGHFRKSFEEFPELSQRGSARNEVSSPDGNPQSREPRSVRSQPLKVGLQAGPRFMKNPDLGRREHLAELWMDRNIRPDSREQVLSIQNPPFHQERSNLPLHDLGSFLARQLAIKRAHNRHSTTLRP